MPLQPRCWAHWDGRRSNSWTACSCHWGVADKHKIVSPEVASRISLVFTYENKAQLKWVDFKHLAR